MEEPIQTVPPIQATARRVLKHKLWLSRCDVYGCLGLDEHIVYNLLAWMYQRYHHVKAKELYSDLAVFTLSKYLFIFLGWHSVRIISFYRLNKEILLPISYNNQQ